ncbi:lytic murein transglycosylase B [Candidatus Methylocalor cossyra]|uniref:Membrane-bound lytic murein transglycosylase B n=1 Tax=Candidatus Methylocalor cossyra TaxID=3108543 RepID=A0ABM9NH90_9GAMM
MTAQPPLPGIAERAEVRQFIATISRRHGFDPIELERLFDKAAIQPAILEAITKPYEAKPWYAYRKLFLTEKRILGGRDFMAVHAPALAAAAARYGVAPEVVTAILGIESSYGQKPGGYRVIDALSTLAFAYPKRAAFFRKELEQFLLLCREEGLSALDPLGSYAGAMGMPQFMPSSYRRLAADGDGDGRRDIWNNPADAIASVARYFAQNGWRRGEPIAARATVSKDPTSLATDKPSRPTHSLAELEALGVAIDGLVPGDPRAALVRLDGESGPLYWVAFHNFFVVMRYNHSPLYAMAAYELSRELVGP